MHVTLLTRHRTLGGELTRGLLTQWDVANGPDGADIQSDLFHEFHDALPDGFDPHAAARYFAREVASEPNIQWYAGVRTLRPQGTGRAQKANALSMPQARPILP